MCKVVTMLSKDTVEHLLLPRFCDLCSDARLFQVRKVTTSKPFSSQPNVMILLRVLRLLIIMNVQDVLFHTAVTTEQAAFQ